MNTSTSELTDTRAVHVRVTKDALAVDLEDGRTVLTPIAWYPRLQHATVQERNHWRLIGNGEGIHWPELDEDISVEGLLAGRRSAEGRKSFAKWLAARTGQRPARNRTTTHLRGASRR